MSPPNADKVASAALTAATAAPPKAVPTISQPVHVDAGSAMASIIAVIEKYRPVAEGIADTVENLAFSKIPFGGLVESFIGPHMAAQYVDQGITQAEALATATGTQLGNQDVFSLILHSFTAAEGWLDTFGLTSKVEGWVKAALAKAGVQV